MIAHALREQKFLRSTPSANVEGSTLCRLFSEMSTALKHGATLLLVGETGTGKTYLSQLLYRNFKATDKRFLCFDCSILTGKQIEQQMLSQLEHQKEDSTLMLIREIESLSRSEQLQFLNRINGEKGAFSEVDGDPSFQTRAIISCQRDLSASVEDGTFRADLYYRLKTHQFEIPPLRNRLDEMAGLTRQFVRCFCQQFNKRVDRIDDSLMNRLMTYQWPGNIRELKHVIERAVMYCDNGILSETDLPNSLKIAEPRSDSLTVDSPEENNIQPVSFDPRLTLEDQLANTERKLIEQALIHNQQCRTDAARELGVSRVTLYNKMKRLGLETLKPVG